MIIMSENEKLFGEARSKKNVNFNTKEKENDEDCRMLFTCELSS